MTVGIFMKIPNRQALVFLTYRRELLSADPRHLPSRDTVEIPLFWSSRCCCYCCCYCSSSTVRVARVHTNGEKCGKQTQRQGTRMVRLLHLRNEQQTGGSSWSHLHYCCTSSLRDFKLLLFMWYRDRMIHQI